MSAREALMRHLTGASLCPPPRPVDEATGLLDAYRAEVLAEQRTTWPSAAELHQAATAKRAGGTTEDIAIANLLNAIANALAWLAPYRTNEGGYEMWGAATTLAQLINGGAESTPDFFQPGHSYTHRDGSDFRCLAVAAHPNTGEQRAFGWRIRNGWTEGATLDPDDWQQYDGCAEPTTGGAS